MIARRRLHRAGDVTPVRSESGAACGGTGRADGQMVKNVGCENHSQRTVGVEFHCVALCPGIQRVWFASCLLAFITEPALWSMEAHGSFR